MKLGSGQFYLIKFNAQPWLTKGLYFTVEMASAHIDQMPSKPCSYQARGEPAPPISLHHTGPSHTEKNRGILKSTKSPLRLMPLNKALFKELLTNHFYFYRDARICYPKYQLWMDSNQGIRDYNSPTVLLTEDDNKCGLLINYSPVY